MYNYNAYGNPYMPNNNLGLQFPNTPIQQPAQPQAAQEIIRVHGEDGAKAYALGPNSSVLLMDETDNIVWAKMTDGAGYATLRGFRITPMETQSVNTTENPQYASQKDFDELKKKVDSLMEELK